MPKQCGGRRQATSHGLPPMQHYAICRMKKAEGDVLNIASQGIYPSMPLNSKAARRLFEELFTHQGFCKTKQTDM